MGLAHRRLRVALMIELLVQVPAGPFAEQVPRCHQSPGRHLRQPRCQLHGFVQTALAFARHVPDHSPLLRVFGAEFVAQHGQAHGPCQTKALDQKPGAAGIGHQTDLAEGLDEARSRRGNG